MKGPIFFALALVLSAAWGCQPGNTSHRDVEKTLGDRERGLNDGDLDLYLSAISPRYGEGVTAFAEGVSAPSFGLLKKRATRLFAMLEKIRYTSSERSLYDEPDGRIRVVQRYAMELHPRAVTTAAGLPATKTTERFKSLSGQEQLWLVKEADGHWRIVGGI